MAGAGPGQRTVTTDHDLFPGFRSERVPTPQGDVFVRSAGHGAPVLLLHGYPQTHAMWHSIAPGLAEHHTVVAADLPGYGSSFVPAARDGHVGSSKRSWGQTMMAVMRELGFDRFSVVGHDRGGRVAYRMASDDPEPLDRVAVLDILPTVEYWRALDRDFALAIHHWMLLAQPAPIPETLIGHDVDTYFGRTFAAIRADGSPVFDALAVEHYVSQMQDPARLSASCNDYRAGASIDVDHDEADLAADRRITVPVLALWGSTGVTVRANADPLSVWQRWAADVQGHAVPGGHYFPEESPAATLAALVTFLRHPEGGNV